ncbi:LOW QUALITY PROTEIN: prolyl 3-hydroxylase 3, partial [Rhinophrynus dorsalis]
MSLVLLFLGVCLSAPHGVSLSASLPPPDLLLMEGVSLFSRGDWSGARGRLRGALRSLREVRGTRLRCGAECGLLGAHVEEAVLGRADCLQNCERLRLGEPTRYRLTQDTERGFHRGAPYNYLQLVHYKLEELDEAAAAAFTFHVRNPHHEQIQDDLKRYRRMKGVKKQSFRDLEEPQHQALFSQAVSLLSEGRIGAALWRLEESLSLYVSALEECRALCEGTRERENEDHRDLSEAIADYYLQVLQCRQRCVLEESRRMGQEGSGDGVIMSRLSLLEDNYAKLEDWEEAAQIARSLLLFSAHNETIKERLRGYEERLKGTSSGKPRETIANYVHRALSEKRQLYYAMENLGVSFQDPDSWTPEEIIPESLRESVRMKREDELQNRGDLPYEEVKLTLTPKQMNGTKRVTLDGVLGEEECEALLSLAQEATGTGDGFKGRLSPHTPRERIHGLSVLRALQVHNYYGVFRKVDSSKAQLYYDASERARVLAQFYFGTEPLHLIHIHHLVCRMAIEGEQEGRTDVSHPVHADNCVLDTEERECWREPPAYVHRDYSALLYLNEDFGGGDLFFTELDGVSVTAELRPRCGRLVVFSSGGENAHGIRAVTQGRQCALALWFTESAEHAEQ